MSSVAASSRDSLLPHSCRSWCCCACLPACLGNCVVSCRPYDVERRRRASRHVHIPLSFFRLSIASCLVLVFFLFLFPFFLSCLEPDRFSPPLSPLTVSSLPPSLIRLPKTALIRLGRLPWGYAHVLGHFQEFQGRFLEPFHPLHSAPFRLSRFSRRTFAATLFAFAPTGAQQSVVPTRKTTAFYGFYGDSVPSPTTILALLRHPFPTGPLGH